MAHDAWLAFGRAIQQHPGLAYLFGFFLPIAGAYWLFALRPYRRGRGQELLSPWQVRRPVIPGVLERYAVWEGASESRLTPFGRWLRQEMDRQNLSFADLARRLDRDVDDLIPVVYRGAGYRIDSETIRTLAVLLGAGEHQIDTLLRAELAASAETHR
jgi:cbb3-type cytochrome oxidase subunit 3